MESSGRGTPPKVFSPHKKDEKAGKKRAKGRGGVKKLRGDRPGSLRGPLFFCQGTPGKNRKTEKKRVRAKKKEGKSTAAATDESGIGEKHFHIQPRKTCHRKGKKKRRRERRTWREGSEGGDEGEKRKQNKKEGTDHLTVHNLGAFVPPCRAEKQSRREKRKKSVEEKPQEGKGRSSKPHKAHPVSCYHLRTPSR